MRPLLLLLMTALNTLAVQSVFATERTKTFSDGAIVRYNGPTLADLQFKDAGAVEWQALRLPVGISPTARIMLIEVDLPETEILDGTVFFAESGDVKPHNIFIFTHQHGAMKLSSTRIFTADTGPIRGSPILETFNSWNRFRMSKLIAAGFNPFSISRAEFARTENDLVTLQTAVFIAVLPDPDKLNAWKIGQKFTDLKVLQWVETDDGPWGSSKGLIGTWYLDSEAELDIMKGFVKGQRLFELQAVTLPRSGVVLVKGPNGEVLDQILAYEIDEFDERVPEAKTQAPAHERFSGPLGLSAGQLSLPSSGDCDDIASGNLPRKKPTKPDSQG